MGCFRVQMLGKQWQGLADERRVYYDEQAKADKQRYLAELEKLEKAN